MASDKPISDTQTSDTEASNTPPSDAPLSTPQAEDKTSYGMSVAKGTAYAVVMRLSIRLMGLVSLSVTSRILSPEDFGVVATATIALGIFTIFRETGLSEILVRTPDLTDSKAASVWTLRLILSIGVSLAAMALAVPVSWLLGEPRVAPVLFYLAFVPTLEALASPASAFLIRSFRFGKDFVLKISQKSVQVIAAITAALTIGNYWALVVAMLAGTVGDLILSQIFHPFRYRLTLSHFGEIRGFAFWTFWRNLSINLSGRIDSLVVRPLLNSSIFGLYHVARELTQIFVVELVGQVQRATLPALSRMQDDAQRMADATARLMGLLALTAVALSLGVVAVAHDMLVTLLGWQWEDATPFLQLLAPGAAFTAIATVNQSLFIALDRQKLSAAFWAARAGVFAAGCAIAGYLAGPHWVAGTFSILAMLVTLAEIHTLRRLTGAAFSLTGVFFRPVAAGGLMVWGVWSMPAFIAQSLILTLALKVAVGAAIYGTVIILLWLATGRPQGGEATLLDYLGQILERLRQRLGRD